MKISMYVLYMYAITCTCTLLRIAHSHSNADSGYNPVCRISVLYEYRDEDGRSAAMVISTSSLPVGYYMYLRPSTFPFPLTASTLIARFHAVRMQYLARRDRPRSHCLLNCFPSPPCTLALASLTNLGRYMNDSRGDTGPSAGHA